jgi:hypothetical protein
VVARRCAGVGICVEPVGEGVTKLKPAGCELTSAPSFEAFHESVTGAPGQLSLGQVVNV